MVKRGNYKTPIELSRMSNTELLAEARRMFGAANKRINRLEDAGLNSPAYVAVTEGAKFSSYQGRYKTGKFYLSDFNTDVLRNRTGTWYKERNRLINEMTRASMFLDDKTSTVRGARTYLNYVNKLFNREMEYSEFKDFFEQYHKWLEEYVPAYNHEKRYEYVEQYKARLLSNSSAIDTESDVDATADVDPSPEVKSAFDSTDDWQELE